MSKERNPMPSAEGAVARYIIGNIVTRFPPGDEQYFWAQRQLDTLSGPGGIQTATSIKEMIGNRIHGSSGQINIERLRDEMISYLEKLTNGT